MKVIVKIEDLQVGDVLPGGAKVEMRDCLCVRFGVIGIEQNELRLLFGPTVEVERPAPALEPTSGYVSVSRGRLCAVLLDNPLPDLTVGTFYPKGTEPKVPADVVRAAKNTLSPYSGCFEESRVMADFILKLAGEGEVGHD